ncbi:MAG: hypothetical protein AAF493_08000 [Pseudomonadota bacterium]
MDNASDEDIIARAKQLGLDHAVEQFQADVIGAHRAARRYVNALRQSAQYPDRISDEPAHVYRADRGSSDV